MESITVLPVGENVSFSAVVSDIHTRKAPSQGPAVRGEGVAQEHRARHRARLIWMGQRMVPGIEAGVELTFEGMVRPVEALPTIYNPRYEIIGRPRENQ
ncbi:hypothetical protein [Arthrobacter roseus]|uniref:hypothetical protein n=1 Tax=Arthrobacter roseus TaxID=136274 RepID=UPI001EF7724B|nr:hypothetical protein [Arthrobacter roseus]MBM7848386.1 hypothetical protein [Arthrobacter roseus]